MKRLLVIPMCFVTACTFTISTTGEYKHSARRASYRPKITKHAPASTLEPTPELKDRVHEQYRNIYDKIKP